MARFVFLESVRGADHRWTGLDEGRGAAHPAVQPARPEGTDDAVDESLLEDLDRCLQRLSAYDRELILEYYAGDEQERIGRRHVLAARLHLTTNALCIRACRIRDSLEGCLNAQSSRR